MLGALHVVCTALHVSDTFDQGTQLGLFMRVMEAALRCMMHVDEHAGRVLVP